MATYVADGTTLARQNDDSPQTYDSIPQLMSLSVVGQERALIDVTNLSSTAREWKKALKDGLEMPCSAQWDPDNAIHVLIVETDLDANTARSWKVTFPDSPAQTVTFNAIVTRAVVTQIEIDSVLMLEFTLKPTGDLTWS